MTLDEIRSACLRQIEFGSCNVGFVLPGRWGKRNTRRLWSGGPQGKIVSELSQGIYVMFQAQEVLAHVEKLIGEEREEKP